MPYYRSVGSVPPKRHTQHRDAEGHLYYEELMGEEGFSSDSSLLYHRGVPSAIVDSQVWELPDQSRTPNHPLKPRHLKLHTLFPEPAGLDGAPGEAARARSRDAGWCWATTTSASATSSPAPTPRRTTATRSATSACTSSPAAGVVESVFGVIPYRTQDYVMVPRSTTHRWVPSEPSRLYADRGQLPHRAAQALPVTVRPAAGERAVLRARPARAGRDLRRRGHATSRCWSSTASAARWSAPG